MGQHARSVAADDDREAFLAIYLRDHHAAAAGGVDLARRIETRGRQGAHVAQLAELRRQIESDRAELTRILRLFDVKPNPVKIVMVRIGERLSRLKLNGRLLSSSPLSTLVELETLAVGITGKRALWLALEATRDDDRRLASVEFGGLVSSANAQFAQVERLRLDAANTAFGGRNGEDSPSVPRG
jgi:hypothetical protein